VLFNRLKVLKYSLGKEVVGGEWFEDFQNREVEKNLWNSNIIFYKEGYHEKVF